MIRTLSRLCKPTFHLKDLVVPFLTLKTVQNFTLTSKKTQLILHSETEVQKIHLRKKQKRNEWSTIREQNKSQFRVSLIGLPNSGKSTLFNCIVGERLAIVDNQPGLTRDRREATILDGLVRIIDTPGIEVDLLSKKDKGGLKNDIFRQTLTAIHQSDLIIVVVDAKRDLSVDEIEMVKYLRKFHKNQKIILACNKAENIFDETQIIAEVSRLGIEDVFMCSGEEGTGIYEIIQHIDKAIPQDERDKLTALKAARVEKFEQIVKRLKQQLREVAEKQGISIKEWERDFRRINPQPELNEDLDQENIEDFILKPEQAFSKQRGTQIKNLRMKNTIKICFIGRPNVGKSSLINQILGEQKMIVSEVPNTTRDSIKTKVLYKNRKFEVIDTAGLHNHIIQKTEQEYLKKIQISTKLHIKECHVVVYVMDAYSAFKIEDFKLIRDAIEEGRPIVIAVNKWQAIKEQFRYKAKNYLMKQIDENLGHTVHGYPLVFVSAKMNEGIDGLLDMVINSYDKWNSRISTGLLNDWLSRFKKRDNLPKDEQMTLKINYLIQARVRPPHFIFFVNSRRIFKDNYMRFLTDNVAKEFKMDGIPLRCTLRSTNRGQNKETKKKDKASPKKVSEMKQKMDELKKKYNNFGL